MRLSLEGREEGRRREAVGTSGAAYLAAANFLRRCSLPSRPTLPEESGGEMSCEDEDEDGVSPPTRLPCIPLNTRPNGPVGVLAIRMCLLLQPQTRIPLFSSVTLVTSSLVSMDCFCNLKVPDCFPVMILFGFVCNTTRKAASALPTAPTGNQR